MNTISWILILCAVYNLSLVSAQKRRLQQSQSQPEPTRMPIIGPSGLDCTPVTDDNLPDNCIPPGGQTLMGSPRVECKENFDCCLCKSMICGTSNVPCKKLNCNGDQACLGVQDIMIVGDGEAEINCNGDYSCNTVFIKGEGIKKFICNGDHSCAKSQFDLICNPDAPCAIQCSGDNSCQGAPRPHCENTIPQTCSIFNIRNTAGLSCADNACSNAVFRFENNFGGNILCNGEISCMDTEIVINDVALLICGQAMACKNADITITDPRQDFSLQCTAPGSCEGMVLTLIINSEDTTALKGIRCADAAACRGLTVQIARTTDLNVFIEKLECTGLNACENAQFLLGEGVSFQTCNCGASTDRACNGIKGIDSCLTGLEKLECTSAIGGCVDTLEVIENPANNFELICGDIRSCELFYLTMNVNDLGAAPIEFFKGYRCTNTQSCKDAVITVNNQQSRKELTIDRIDCTGTEACMNAQFVANGNVQIEDITCSKNDSCNGCTYTINEVCRNCDGDGDSYCPDAKCKRKCHS